MSGPGSSAVLRLESAVPLGYVLVLRAAAGVGVRALAIKGPVLRAQGLREATVSVDVDILVDPATVSTLVAELERLGWRDVGDYGTPRIVPYHSVNHRHPLWPCEIDLHHWFPGFLADPAVTFDVLWSRRTTLRVAHVDVDATDPTGSVAIAALHYLRDRHKIEPLAALIDVVRREWGDDQLADLAHLAAATGAADTLRPFLDEVGAPRVPGSRSLAVPLSDWQMRSQARTTEVLPWLVGLTRTPWWRRPAFVWHALWRPGPLGQADPPGHATRGWLARSRWHRLVRAARALPTAVSDFRRLRRRE